MSRRHAIKSTNNVLITLMNLILFFLIKYMIQDSELPSYFLPVLARSRGVQQSHDPFTTNIPWLLPSLHPTPMSHRYAYSRQASVTDRPCGQNASVRPNGLLGPPTKVTTSKLWLPVNVPTTPSAQGDPAATSSSGLAGASSPGPTANG